MGTIGGVLPSQRLAHASTNWHVSQRPSIMKWTPWPLGFPPQPPRLASIFKPPDRNPLWPDAPSSTQRCGDCVWKCRRGGGWGCHRHPRQALRLDWPACPAFTAQVDCATCGACCREAYHAVELGPRDPFIRLNPDRVITEEGRKILPRPDGRCLCLTQDDAGWRCDRYDSRPRTCRDFEQGGFNCLEARRRVKLTI